MNVLNSNTILPKILIKCEARQHDELIKPLIDLPEDVNIKESQENDEQITKLKNWLYKGNATTTKEKKLIEIADSM